MDLPLNLDDSFDGFVVNIDGGLPRELGVLNLTYRLSRRLLTLYLVYHSLLPLLGLGLGRVHGFGCFWLWMLRSDCHWLTLGLLLSSCQVGRTLSSIRLSDD